MEAQERLEHVVGNAFGYVQLHTPDMQGAQRFYGELFDWELEPTGPADKPYVEIRVGEGVAGGMMPVTDQDPVPRWVPYVQVHDVADMSMRAAALGATVVVPPTGLPDGSFYSLLFDPEGAPFALHGPSSG
ncbi:VOC family protein [Actinomadura sp. ATCC 39365]|uniref:VOC family protein n=1 Tax=Nonomuraea sp. NPDC005692 TaxID=3157168 RepID=UPI0033D5EFEE